MRFFNFFLIHMIQKYQNEIAPIFYFGKSPKTNEKDLKIPILWPLDWGQPYWMTLYKPSDGPFWSTGGGCSSVYFCGHSSLGWSWRSQMEAESWEQEDKMLSKLYFFLIKCKMKWIQGPLNSFIYFPRLEVKVLKWHYQYWADVKITPVTAAAGHLAPLSCDNGAGGGNHLAMFPAAAPWHRHHFKCPHWGSRTLSWSAGWSRSTAPAWRRLSAAAMVTLVNVQTWSLQFIHSGWWIEYMSQRPWVPFWGSKMLASPCTYLRHAKVMEVIIFDI